MRSHDDASNESFRFPPPPQVLWAKMECGHVYRWLTEPPVPCPFCEDHKEALRLDWLARHPPLHSVD